MSTERDEGAEGKQPGDFLRFFVIVMALMAGVLAWVWRRTEAEAAALETANLQARAIFGEEAASGPKSAGDERPRTITGLGVGVLQYLATNRDAGKDRGGQAIPVAVIRDRLQGAGLKSPTIGQENVTKFQGAKRFEEVSVSVTIDPCDLDSLSTFLYNVEQASPIYRILEFRWELRPDKENPYAPGKDFGHLITRPTVKIGFRRPLTTSR